MTIACKYCILEKGLRGSDIDSLPFSDEMFFDHLEREHHIPVRRKGETKPDAMARFQKENPEAGGPRCKCPTCVADRLPRRSYVSGRPS